MSTLKDKNKCQKLSVRVRVAILATAHPIQALGNILETAYAEETIIRFYLQSAQCEFGHGNGMLTGEVRLR
jgi:hypothetical protein